MHCAQGNHETLRWLSVTCRGCHLLTRLHIETSTFEVSNCWDFFLLICWCFNLLRLRPVEASTCWGFDFFSIDLLRLRPVECWGFDLLKLRSVEALTYWSFDHKRLRHMEATTMWGFDILRIRPCEALPYWSFDLLKLRHMEALTMWDFDILKLWPVEASTYWGSKVFKIEDFTCRIFELLSRDHLQYMVEFMFSPIATTTKMNIWSANTIQDCYFKQFYKERKKFPSLWYHHNLHF